MSFASTRGGRSPLVAAATAALALSALLAPSAKADIIFYGSPGGVQPEENVLLSNNGIADTELFGVTNQTGTQVKFTQPRAPEMIVSPSSGQSRIAAADGGAFTSLRTELATGFSFTKFEANPIYTGAGISFTVGVREIDNTLNQQTFISGAGQSYFGIEAINGQRIAYVDINVLPANGRENVIQDVRQIRIGGVARTVDVVPEPGAVAFGVVMGGGLLGMMARGRRRKGVASA
jgi:hypothetical protein